MSSALQDGRFSSVFRNEQYVNRTSINPCHPWNSVIFLHSDRSMYFKVVIGGILVMDEHLCRVKKRRFVHVVRIWMDSDVSSLFWAMHSLVMEDEHVCRDVMSESISHLISRISRS